MGNKVKITAESDAMHKYMKEINDIPSLTAPEQEWLFTKVAEGNNDAINKIVEANLKLVVHIAKRYSSSCSIPLMDLLSVLFDLIIFLYTYLYIALNYAKISL